jgi:hypothetical protein
MIRTMVDQNSTRLSRLLPLLAVAASSLACSEKGLEFFSLGGPTTGTIEAVVDGTPAGATVQLTGEGVSKSQLVGSQVHSFSGLPYGTYVVSVTAPQGYVCEPTTRELTISEPVPIRRASFECAQTPGSFALSVAGLSGNSRLDVNLAGPTPKNGSVGVEGMTFTGLLPGSYQWTYPQLDGYDCAPADGSFDLAPGEQESASVQCTPTEGGIQVTVLGATALVMYNGPETGSANVGATPVRFENLTPGNYNVTVSSPPGFNCLPASTPVTVTAGTVSQVTIECAPQPATITATVFGATAQVNYSGPANGGGEVGATPVSFTPLPAGNYNVTLVEPEGFTCAPESVAVTLAAGETKSVEFECEPEEGEEEPEEVEYSVDLTGFQGSPGGVPPGSYQVPVRDATLTAIAAIAVATIGNQTFFGTGPNRLGFGGTSGYELDVFFQVALRVFQIRALQVCAINAALSGDNAVALTFYSASLVLIGSLAITSSPGCAWYDAPEGTRYVRMIGPPVGFADVYNILLRGFLIP